MARSVELSKSSRFVVLASVCVVVAALYFAREVLIPLALSILLTFLMTPLVRRLERLRLGRVPSVLIVVVVAIALVVGLGYMVEQQFVQIANALPQYKDQIRRKVDRLRGSGGGLGTTVKELETLGKAITPGAGPTTAPAIGPATGPSTRPTTQPGAAAVNPPAANPPPADVGPGTAPLPGLPPFPQPQITPGAPTLPHVTPENPLPVRDYPEPPSPVEQVFKYLGIVLSPLATAGLVIVFVIFMLLGREDLRDRLIRLVGYGQLQIATTAMDDAASRISRYLVSQAIINAVYGVIIATGLWLVGWLFGRGQSFPSVVLWGLLCGILRFVPYIGAWLGMAGPLVVAFGFYDTNGVFFGAVGMFVVVELVVSQVAEPLIYGSSTGMSTLAVLVSAVFWTWLWGPIGLLLSTPMTAVLVVMGKYVPQLQFLDVLLGDEPVLDPHVRIYQRLLAGDQEEALDLAGQYLKEWPLLEVYDDVLLPVLALAKQDRARATLDDDRETFIRQAMRAIIDELGEENRALAPRPSAGERAKSAAAAAGANGRAGGKGASGGAGPISAGHGKGVGADPGRSPDRGPQAAPNDAGSGLPLSVPRECTVNVVCLPAHDEADEITCLMLVQLLEERGYCAFAASQDALASEMVEEVAARGAHVVVVSALPPAAVGHARYLCKRLHGRYGVDLNMVVGLWTAAGDLEKARDRITCAGSARLVPSFRRSLEEMHQLAQSVIIGAAKALGSDETEAVAASGNGVT